MYLFVKIELDWFLKFRDRLPKSDAVPLFFKLRRKEKIFYAKPKGIKGKKKLLIVIFFAFRYISHFLKRKKKLGSFPPPRFTVQTRRNYIIIVNAFFPLYSTTMLVRSDT